MLLAKFGLMAVAAWDGWPCPERALKLTALIGQHQAWRRPPPQRLGRKDHRPGPAEAGTPWSRHATGGHWL